MKDVKIHALLLMLMAGVTAYAHSQTQTLDSLIADLKSDNAGIQASAAAKLIESGKPAVASLLTLIKEENIKAKSKYDESRVAASKVQPERAQMLLRQGREHDRVIKSAFLVLTGIGAPSLEALLDLLKNEPRLRGIVIQSLGEIGDKRAIEPLIGMLDDKDADVREETVTALEKITSQKLGKESAKWKAWWAKNKSRKK